MKVKELILALSKLDPELEVYATSDHGQTPEKVCDPTVIYVEETSYTLWDGWSSYLDEEYGQTVAAVLL